MSRRDAVDAIGAGFVLQGTVLVSGVLAARLLGPEQRGELALLWVVALALAQLGAMGGPAAMAVFLARGNVDARTLFGACARTAAWQVLVVLVVQAGVLAVLMWELAAVITLAAPAAMIAQVYGLSVLQGLGRLRVMQGLRLLPTTAYAAALVIALVLGASSLAWVAFAWAGSYALAAAATCGYAWRVLPARRGEVVDAREVRAFGRRTMLGSISPLETFRVDQLLVGLVLSPLQLGLYVAALAFTNLPRFIAQGIGQVAVARIAPLGLGEARAAVVRFTVLSAGLALVVSAPLAALAGPLVALAFGDAFAGAAVLIPVLLASTVLVCARRVLGDALRGAGHAGAGSVAELCSYVAVVPALAVGVLSGGALGVAWALVGSSLVSLLVLVGLAYRALFVRGKVAAALA
ncbi:oligosaccharide flippase family protein [Solirubrobacter deserti]|uniref:Oligosaccharide flippase family protein n=1 Tax=Solirubrobacter deserti TaxID=2282478 RepID=A0ABT4RU52_9ACTN|nr:oligosaccharide flippase family protein [Solirubrobacter deserti]MDA0142109.1 oligosaccharide flippase family protein [Solirubrobacter deserti]